MLQQNTRESAIRREDFHRALRTWLDESLDDRIGDPESHAGNAWLWVRHGGDHYYLNADTTRDGIRRYVRLVADDGGDPDWTMKDSEEGVRERVAVGRDRRIIDGFEFYRHLPSR